MIGGGGTALVRRSLNERAALVLLGAHLVLLCCGARDYAKIHVFGPLYPTEVVLLCTVVLSPRSLVSVPWEGLKLSQGEPAVPTTFL